MLLSVIVPIYNTAKFLPKCVQSLLAQRIEEIELVFVDDCSTDDSLVVLQEQLKVLPSHVRVQTIPLLQHQEVSEVRKEGVRRATGDYVAWCDADDWVDPDMYATLLQALKEQKADLAFCDFVRHYADHEEVVSFTTDGDTKHCLEQAADYSHFCVCLWCYVMPRSLALRSLEAIAPVSIAEDLFSLMHAFLSADVVAHVARPLYHYNKQNPQSVMTRRRYPAGMWVNQKSNVERLLKRLQPSLNRQYTLTCNWLKFRIKSNLQQAFPSLHAYYKEYQESHRDIMSYTHLSLYDRRKLSFMYSSFPIFCLYNNTAQVIIRLRSIFL